MVCSEGEGPEAKGDEPGGMNEAAGGAVCGAQHAASAGRTSGLPKTGYGSNGIGEGA